LLFRCPLSVYVWAVVRDVPEWNALPNGVKGFVEFFFSRGDKRNGKLVFLFGAVFWTIWLNRNDLVFNSKSVATPRALIF
jgi:hypothetical protein